MTEPAVCMVDFYLGNKNNVTMISATKVLNKKKKFAANTDDK